VSLGAPRGVSLDAPSRASLGAPRVHFRVVDSTNARARDLAARAAPHGTLVTAAEQSAGRGRQGRTWSAPPGRALLCSIIVRDPPRLLPLAVGVAVAEEVGGGARVRWPNDVLLDGRKVAGILVEGRPQERWAVAGIGLNVAVREGDLPAALNGRAGTLGRSVQEIEPTLTRLLASLEHWIAAAAPEVLAALRDRDALLGRQVHWASGAGEAAGVDEDGRLLVATPAGRVALEAGEVHLG
jgi:BirA family transcriptional regulator, biotin operon repressor / biotin---[acetyl-CoA-carboxylase] ligase